MRFRTAAVAALVVLVVDLPSAEASQAALQRARREADAAAAGVARAQTRLSGIESEIASLEARQAENEARLASLEGVVRELAVAQFMRGNRSADLPAEVDPLDASAGRRAVALTRMVASGSDDAVDAYRAVAEDHALAAERLSSRREAASAAVAEYRRQSRLASSRLQRLVALENERIAAEQAKRRRAARSTVRSGRTGRSSARIIGSGSWICPVQGPRAFTNDWGDPRGGGRRRHQGTDILAPRGTPVVAPVAGVARRHNSGLGGLSYYLRGADGHTYFGTHLNSYSDNFGRVAAGTVLGYVGNSGNARGGPTHLHFEIHPGGGGPVNPYPTLRQYC